MMPAKNSNYWRLDRFLERGAWFLREMADRGPDR